MKKTTEFIIFLAIVVVATGSYAKGFVTTTEVIDLNNPSDSCTLWADSFPVYEAVGGFFDNGLFRATCFHS